MKSIASIEDALLSDDYFRNPYPLFERLRCEHPVYWSDKLASWLVTRYDDCQSIVSDADTFSSSGRVAYLLNQLPEELQASIEPLRRHYAVGLAHSDPPAHTRLRGVLRELINPAVARANAEAIRNVVLELLDGIETTEPFDFVKEFAYPLPATVVADIIGAPREDIAKFKAWADDIAGLFEYGGKMSADAAMVGVQSLSDIRTYILRLLSEARGKPGGTIIATLANLDPEDVALTEQEIVSTLVTLFVAGHETTTNLLGMAVKALIEDPTLANDLQNDPALIPGAVREFLRYETVVPRAWRMATRDVEMGGQPIRKGEMVMAMLGSANRDPAEFEDPDRLNIHRSTRRNFGFGSGIHICLGAPLARIEGTIALEEILNRFANIESAAPPAWRRDMALRGLISLPVRITPH